MPEKLTRSPDGSKEIEKPSANVTLPPIDATPEEIAQALVRRPPVKRPMGDDCD